MYCSVKQKKAANIINHRQNKKTEHRPGLYKTQLRQAKGRAALTFQVKSSGTVQFLSQNCPQNPQTKAGWTRQWTLAVIGTKQYRLKES